MKIYIISLRDSKERRAKISRDLTKIGLQFEFFDAINGRDLSEDEIKATCDEEAIRKYPNWLKPGAIGCALSHYNVYKKILECNDDKALILEDDAKVSSDLPELLNKLEGEINKNEIVMLYFASWQTCQLSYINSKKITSKYKLYYPLDARQPISAMGYIITKKACKQLIPVILPIRYGADTWGSFFEDGGINSIRCVYPMPVDNYDPLSTIGYVNNDSVFKKIIGFLNVNKVFPIYHILRWRRKLSRKSMNKVNFVSIKSPLDPS